MRKLAIGVVVLAGVCLLTGVWWDNGGQTWLAVHTGTDYCVNVPPDVLTACRAYGYWSAPGSVFPWVLIGAGGVIGVLWAHLRSINCHERSCWRIGIYPVVGGAFRLCGKHHPDWEGKHPSRDHIVKRHEEHKAAVTAKPRASRKTS